jgi:hypothetical protein
MQNILEASERKTATAIRFSVWDLPFPRLNLVCKKNLQKFYEHRDYFKDFECLFAISCRKNYLGSSLNSDVYIRGVVSEQQSTKCEALLHG